MCTARRCHTCMSRMLPGAPFHVGRVALATTLEAAPAHCASRRVPASAEVGHASFPTLRACDHVLVTARATARIPRRFRRAGRRRGTVRSRRRRTGSRRVVIGSSRSRRSTFRARRPAATGSRRGPSASCTTWASRIASRASNASTVCARSRTVVTLELAWPEHPDFPSYGYVVRRRELDEMVAEQAVKAGRDDLAGRRGGRARRRRRPARRRDGARQGLERASCPVRARYVVVADGANSRFGRALGTARDRSFPLGMAIRGYFTSPFHDEPWIESHLDIRDRDGNHLPGYGWIFPVGDGTVNVGVGLLSTFQGWKNVNTTPPDGGVLRDRARPAGASRADTATGAPTGGRLPTGGSVTPRVGPTFVVAGDAAGLVNPFNGEGISVAYETGRLAADAVDLALDLGRRARAADLRRAARGGVRPLLQGRARVRARDRQPGRDARADAGSGCRAAR